MESTQIEQLLQALKTQGTAYTELRDAANGKLVTLSEEMAAVLGGRRRKSVPVLGVAVEAISNKLFTKTIAADKVTVTKLLQTWLTANRWLRLERALYKAVSRDGHAFLLVTWENSQPKLTVREAFDGAEGAALIGGIGVNVYKQENDLCADFYYPDKVEKYIQKRSEQEWQRRQDAPDEVWPLDWTDLDSKPLGVALVRVGDGESDIAPALQVQRDLNEGLLDAAATSRTQGWPQRYIAGDTGGQWLTNANGQPIRTITGNPIRRELRLAPGSVMQLVGEKATLGQLAASTVDRTLVDVHLELISLLTTVPTHYFSGQWPSGVALLQAESRLNARVEDHQGVITEAIVATAQLMLRLARTFGGLTLDSEQAIVVEWYPPQVFTEDLLRDREDATVKLYEAGLLSLREALRRLHEDWTEEQLIAEEAAIQKAAPTSSSTVESTASASAQGEIDG